MSHRTRVSPSHWVPAHHREHRHNRGRLGLRPRRGRLLPILRRLPLPALVACGVLAVGGVAVLGSLLVLMVTMALPIAMVGGVVVLIARHQVRRALRQYRPGPMVVQARPVPRPEVAWGRARTRFATVCAEYAAYECDPMNVLRLPALADVSVPSTARFVEAFAEAQALETDALPPVEHATAFTAAADRAQRAWRAACDAAERIRLSGLSPAERSTVERVIKLLTTARDSDSDAERLAAYSRARSELTKLANAGVLHLPRLAQATLDAASRGQLPA